MGVSPGRGDQPWRVCESQNGGQPRPHVHKNVRKHPKSHPKKADEKQREKVEKSDYLDLRELYSRGQKACFRTYQVTILKSLRPSYELTWFF